jgi:hypothetical protein
MDRVAAQRTVASDKVFELSQAPVCVFNDWPTTVGRAAQTTSR